MLVKLNKSATKLAMIARVNLSLILWNAYFLILYFEKCSTGTVLLDETAKVDKCIGCCTFITFFWFLAKKLGIECSYFST